MLLQIDGRAVHFKEKGLAIFAYFGSHQVGRIKLMDNGDGTVLLSDVEVDEKVEVKQGTVARLIRALFPDWGFIFPRQHGIGTELLERFVRSCERAGVVEIYGNVTPDADRDYPFLSEWYGSSGFVVSPPDGRDECIPTKYKVIWRKRKDAASNTSPVLS